MAAPDALDGFIRRQLLRMPLGVERRLAQVFGRALATTHGHHARHSEPGHRHRLEDHQRGREDVGGDDGVGEVECFHVGSVVASAAQDRTARRAGGRRNAGSVVAPHVPFNVCMRFE